MSYKKILIAVEDSPAAEKVAQHGIQLAQQLNAEATLVSVIDTTILMTDASAGAAEMAEEMKADLQLLHKSLIEKMNNNNVKSSIAEGTPYDAILRFAEVWNADLLVIGTHGRTGLPHVLMGSVAEKIVRHSVQPVLVVPTKKQD